MANERHSFFVDSPTDPTIELDPHAGGVYIRFKNAAVAKTIEQQSERMFIAVDLDGEGEVVGIEAVGATNCSLNSLLDYAKVEAPNTDLRNAPLVFGDELAAQIA